MWNFWWIFKYYICLLLFPLILGSPKTCMLDFFSILSALIPFLVYSILFYCAPIWMCSNDLYSSSKILSSALSNLQLYPSSEFLVFVILLFSCRISFFFFNHVSGPMLCASYSLSHLNPHKSLGGRYHQYLYVQSKGTETQRDLKMSKSHSKELMILKCKPRKSDSVSSYSY